MAATKAPNIGPRMNTQQLAKGCQFPITNPVLSCRPMATAGFRQPPVWMAKCLEKNRATAMITQHMKVFGVKSVFEWITIRIVHTNIMVPMNSDRMSPIKSFGLRYV